MRRYFKQNEHKHNTSAMFSRDVMPTGKWQCWSSGEENSCNDLSSHRRELETEEKMRFHSGQMKGKQDGKEIPISSKRRTNNKNRVRPECTVALKNDICNSSMDCWGWGVLPSSEMYGTGRQYQEWFRYKKCRQDKYSIHLSTFDEMSSHLGRGTMLESPKEEYRPNAAWIY